MRTRMRWSASLGVVGLALLLSTLLAWGQPEAPPDIVIVNGRVEAVVASPAGGRDARRAGTRALAAARALAIRGGHVQRVGSDEDIRRLAGPGTRIVDAKGGSVLPGFDDTHLHLLSGGMGLRGVSLDGMESLEEIQEALRVAARRQPGSGWLEGRGWDYNDFGGDLPTRADIDEVVADRPVYLRAYDGHTGWANTLALKRAGITAKTPDPPGGVIVRDPRTGVPTGILKESAENLMEKVIPAPTFAAQQEALRAAVREAHRVGVTAVGEAGATFDEMRVFQSLRASGELKLRTYVALSLDDALPDADLEKADALRSKYAHDPFLRVGAVKLFIDGVIESGTARLLAPYAGSKTAGKPLMTQAELDGTIATLAGRGWQVWTHAIGDGGVRMVLDAIERSGGGDLAKIRARRHRIEHAEIIDPSDLPRFAHLGVIASQQPLHGSPDALGAWSKSLGENRARRGWAHGSLHAAGARLAFGSDWPVVTLDPLPALRMAVTRRAGQVGWTPRERLSLSVALEAYGEGGAFASFDEGRRGRLVAGQLADVVVLSRDIHEEVGLQKARVVVTIVDGKVVYERRR